MIVTIAKAENGYIISSPSGFKTWVTNATYDLDSLVKKAFAEEEKNNADI